MVGRDHDGFATDFRRLGQHSMPIPSAGPIQADDKSAWISIIFDYELPRPSAGGPRRRNLEPLEPVDCSFDRMAGAYVQAIRLKALALV